MLLRTSLSMYIGARVRSPGGWSPQSDGYDNRRRPAVVQVVKAVVGRGLALQLCSTQASPTVPAA